METKRKEQFSKEVTNFSILWWIGVMETQSTTLPIYYAYNFSILWWIGVMETKISPVLHLFIVQFQYPLVDWGDGDCIVGVILSIIDYFSILWWIGVMETRLFLQSVYGISISVSSGGLG